MSSMMVSMAFKPRLLNPRISDKSDDDDDEDVDDDSCNIFCKSATFSFFTLDILYFIKYIKIDYHPFPFHFLI